MTTLQANNVTVISNFGEIWTLGVDYVGML